MRFSRWFRSWTLVAVAVCVRVFCGAFCFVCVVFANFVYGLKAADLRGGQYCALEIISVLFHHDAPKRFERTDDKRTSVLVRWIFTISICIHNNTL